MGVRGGREPPRKTKNLDVLSWPDRSHVEFSPVLGLLPQHRPLRALRPGLGSGGPGGGLQKCMHFNVAIGTKDYSAGGFCRWGPVRAGSARARWSQCGLGFTQTGLVRTGSDRAGPNRTPNNRTVPHPLVFNSDSDIKRQPNFHHVDTCNINVGLSSAL